MKLFFILKKISVVLVSLLIIVTVLFYVAKYTWVIYTINQIEENLKVDIPILKFRNFTTKLTNGMDGGSVHITAKLAENAFEKSIKECNHPQAALYEPPFITEVLSPGRLESIKKIQKNGRFNTIDPVCFFASGSNSAFKMPDSCFGYRMIIQKSVLLISFFYHYDHTPYCQHQIK